MADYSDDEVQMMDDGDTEAQMMGEAQAFDAATGMPVPSGSNGAAMDDDDAADARRAALAEVAGVSSSSSSPSVETWQLTLAEKNQANTQDITVPHMIGIDEAGRGPVLGSMVYGICWCPVSKLDELKDIKVADSKTLTFAQREGLFRNIQQCPWLGYEVDVISADRLSREMMRRQRINLNAISHDSAISLIQQVVKHGVNVREIYVDTVGDPQKYQEKIEAMFPGVAVTVAKKADSLFPVVSAASIAAKVTRDLNLDQWQFAEERPRNNGHSGAATPRRSDDAHSLRCSRRLGSGYPGDPLTKVWLQNHLDAVFGYPSLVRFSWGTTKKILKAQAVQAEWGDEDDEEDADADDDEEGGGGRGAQRMDKFFAKEPAAAAAAAAAASAKASAATAAASASAPALVTGGNNNKRFSSLHESVTRKQHAVPCAQRIGFFQRHRMDLATTF